MITRRPHPSGEFGDQNCGISTPKLSKSQLRSDQRRLPGDREEEYGREGEEQYGRQGEERHGREGEEHEERDERNGEEPHWFAR